MKRLILLLLVAGSVGAQGTNKDTTPIGSSPELFSAGDFQTYPFITIGGNYLIQIEAKKDNMMVTITRDGKVTYGDGYKPDDAAKVFWERLAEYYPVVCKKFEPSPNEKEKQP